MQADYIGCTMLNSIEERKDICDSDGTKHVTLAFSVIVSNQLSLRAQLAGRAAGDSHEGFLKSVCRPLPSCISHANSSLG